MPYLWSWLVVRRQAVRSLVFFHGLIFMIRSFWMRLQTRTLATSWQSNRLSRLSRRRKQLEMEALESRDVPSATFEPTYVRINPNGGFNPLGSPGPTGYTPSQVRHAYGFDQINFAGGTVAGDGAGTTIAIVDAYDDPRIANDLHQFDVAFGLPDPVFTKVNQSGGTTMPAANGGWASEIALDVEWAHAIAPKANILLVEANDNSYSNLMAAVSFAAKQSGVVAVSMSWGGGEFSTETGFDSTFKTPTGHQGVTFVVSSGDAGAPASYPATSPNALAVGGTHLSLDSSGNILGESAWSGSGGGISSYETEPTYQKGVVTQTTTNRANPDVSYDADPNTGFPVYDTYNNSTTAPWSQFGGTSDAAPQWAALIAIADQGRALAGLGSLDGATQTLPAIYSMPSTDFHDITSGSSTGSPSYSATAGYDLATGRGTPFANRVVADLVGQSSTPGATHYAISAPTSTTAGASFSVTVTAADASGSPVAGYTGTVHFTSSDGAAILPANYTFTSADKGVHTFTVTLKTAGSKTVTATDTVNGSLTGTATLTVSPAAASKLLFGQQPTNANAGATISPAVTVQVQDQYGNLVTSDNTDQVTVAIGSNPGGGTLSGTGTVTVSGGVATFSTLSIDKVGVGYTLTANSGLLAGTTSSSFSITSSGSTGGSGSTRTIEDFKASDSWYVTGSYGATAYLSSAAAHDGALGLDDYNGSDWIYRTDANAVVKQGDTVSVWLKFSGAANGRAYFGFGASAGGTLSLVAAPNTNQLILQNNAGWGFTNLAAVSQTYVANHWYRLEVAWGTSGKIIGRLYDSNGTTLLKSVTATTTAITSGGIAFRSIGNDKFWDTVTATSGANSFTSSSSSPTIRSLIFSAAKPAESATAGNTKSSQAMLYDSLLELYMQWARARRSALTSELSAWGEFV